MNSRGFAAGFEKQAGLFQRGLDKIKGLVTGKQYLYHGTSPSRAEKILRGGLKPNQPGGISAGAGLQEANRGLTFTSKSRDVAELYGRQQAALEKTRRGFDWLGEQHRRFGKHLPRKLNRLASQAMSRHVRPLLEHTVARSWAASSLLHPKGHVHRIAIPKEEFRRMKQVTNPELQRNKEVSDMVTKEIAKKHPTAARVTGKAVRFLRDLPYRHDVVFKGGVPSRYIKE